MNTTVPLISKDQTLARIRRMVRLLDSAIAVPGTRFRIGLDPLLGLVPGIGDVISLVLSAYVVQEARRLGLPNRVVRLMLFNVALDAVIGSIPLVGDIFDFAFKANVRNLGLLEKALAEAGDSGQALGLLKPGAPSA